VSVEPYETKRLIYHAPTIVLFVASMAALLWVFVGEKSARQNVKCAEHRYGSVG
jgi:hypothetical protein